jgi:hypothetical protein
MYKLWINMLEFFLKVTVCKRWKITVGLRVACDNETCSCKNATLKRGKNKVISS